MLSPSEFGCSESIGESMHVGNPVVQHDGDHLDLVARDGGLSLDHEGTLHRGSVEDHSRGGSGLAGDFDTGLPSI